VCVFCVEKDVARTDRSHAFFHGDNNPNLTVLNDILLTHCMYNFDLGVFTSCVVCLFFLVGAVSIVIDLKTVSTHGLYKCLDILFCVLFLSFFLFLLVAKH